MEIGYRAIPQDGGNPTQVNDAISAPPFLPLCPCNGGLVGWLAAWHTTRIMRQALSSPLSSSIKTFPLSLSLISARSLSPRSLTQWADHECGSEWMERTTTECKGMQRSGLSLSLEAGVRGRGEGERAILDNVICSIACSHGDGDRLASCMALRHVSDSSIKVKTHININVLNKSGSRNHPPLRWSFFQWSVRWSPFLCAPGLGESII